MNSMELISVIGKQRVGQANSVGPIIKLGGTDFDNKLTREFAL